MKKIEVLNPTEDLSVDNMMLCSMKKLLRAIMIPYEYFYQGNAIK